MPNDMAPGINAQNYSSNKSYRKESHTVIKKDINKETSECIETGEVYDKGFYTNGIMGL